MDWSILLSTAVGALLGIAATLATDRARSRREDRRHWNQIRRETYIEFLTAMSAGHTSLRRTAHRASLLAEERYSLLHAAVDDSGLWRSRQALSLAAPYDVIQKAIIAAQAIEGVRDALITEPDIAGVAYVQARSELWAANAELREAMRQDLGVVGPPDPEVLAIRQRREVERT